MNRNLRDSLCLQVKQALAQLRIRLVTTQSTSCSGQGTNAEGQSIPGPSTAESLDDIGTLAKPSASVEETSLKMCNGERYTLLFHHIGPPTSLPTTFAHGCHRRFSVSWLDTYPWLRYRPSLDGVFCGYSAS